MLKEREISLIEQRRDAIRAWLDEQAPYVIHDQRHLDTHTPEQAYWQFGYQAALADILRMLAQSTSDTSPSSEGKSRSHRPDAQDEPGSPAD